MSRSVIVAAGIFTLGVVAADVTIASVFMMSPANQTVPAGLGGRDSLVDEPLAMAGVNLLALPFVLACIARARDYVQGLTAAMVESA
jgi:ABC-type glycerol-3-phosphate transport system permease component